ncbi:MULTISPECIES: SgcJ/EcaC family oxidoreductase [unclassified Nocardiopsis]|uniref:SgcJ/EcaC family oxidoreductase n=1 Tax=unclassified Nocardiopsis TaxID=2649073 RepID=UPI001357EF16|nr:MULTISPECIES: SgcJ/EcaC family oxidoreductase [unclassified Nocardiopsis]
MAETAHPEIHALVRSLEDAFNDHDPVALGGHFAPDALWTNAAGRRIRGREAFVAFGREVAPRLADAYARYEVVDALEVRPDVVAVHVAQTPVDAGGEVTAAPRASAVYVFARGERGWEIVVGQNTVVAG